MRRFLPLFLILFPFEHLGAAGNEEFRATWVVDQQWLAPDNSVEANKSLTRSILENHRKAAMNAVLWQIRRFGNVYFDSSIEPWGKSVGFTYPGYDPLAYAIQEAHARGLEFHAWFNVFESRFAFPGSPAERHPEWVCRDRDGNPMPPDIAWLSPGLPQVRQYLIDVAMELVRNYDIDGLHLDFVRWNEHTNSAQSLLLAKKAEEQGLPDGIITRAQLEELITNASGRYLYDVEHPFDAGVPQGFNSWEDWWRWSVTEFVRVLHDSIRAVKPWVRLSPAALGRYNWGGWQGFDVVYQDAALWFNEGYIDQLVGMHYHWFTGDEFYRMLTGGCPECWSQYIQPGIEAGRLYTVGPFSDRMSDNNIWGRHAEIVKSSRSVPWVDGFQFFSYRSWNDHNYWEEARSHFFSRKTKIRAMQLVVDTPPDPPIMKLRKIDSLRYEITLVPPTSALDDHWAAIYRTPDTAFDVNLADILDIHFGDSSYSFVDQFTGTQDYNGTYNYFGTVFDRYWNESAISNVVQSDTIPSFAPTVVSTFPAPHDTIPVNLAVMITFSKTMEVNSFSNAVSFEPEVVVSELTWSENHKTMTVTTTENFDYATDYILTIAPTVTDINGKPLDGNGDGVGGDAFELRFRTQAQDLLGPVIVYSYPDHESYSVGFAIDDVITLLFDEIVDPISIDNSTMVLTQGANDISTSYHLTTVNNRSVLSIQPLQTLEPNTEYSFLLSGPVSDTLGNRIDSDIAFSFRTSPEHYVEIVTIDRFLSTSNWWQPWESGSTTGINRPNTTFEMSTEAYLPASPRRQRISAVLRFEWDTSATSFLIRLFLAGDQPRSVLFDTTYILQCYVFGDGSHNSLRFAVDDSTKDQAAFHEVSTWIPIDWYGWRLLEWPLNDPNSVGEWIGDGVLHGPSLRFDSFQLTHEPGAASRGTIYFDNLRLVKKSALPVTVAELHSRIPRDLTLYQNYPNPFNPTTTIAFDIPKEAHVQLLVYNTLGREVARLVDMPMMPGHYETEFDGSEFPSGVYFYRLIVNGQQVSRRMLLVK